MKEMNMNKKILQKLKNNHGESISEVLIAGLVVALAFVMVASLISASSRMIQKTDDAMSTYYSDINAFESGTASTGTGKLTVTSNGEADDATKVLTQSAIDVTVKYEDVGSGTSTKQYVTYEKAGS